MTITIRCDATEMINGETIRCPVALSGLAFGEKPQGWGIKESDQRHLDYCPKHAHRANAEYRSKPDE